MKIVLIAPGFQPFPPRGWGACESIVWDYYENLTKRGYDVEIVNHTNTFLIVKETNGHEPDVVHIMYDDHIVVAPYLQCKRIYYTTHFAYITDPHFETAYGGYFRGIFKRAIEYAPWITLNAISEKIKQVYVKHGFPEERIQVIGNGSREDLFRFTENPQKGKRSVYVAKIEFRKSQYKYQSMENLDFVGNYQDSPFDTTQSNYLGEWDKPTLYENLTDYGNLVLLSNGEADPLVVKEALMAGLGVVVSECASANLDLTRPFITVIPDDKRDDVAFVAKAIAENRQTSLENRRAIREYALAHFAWDKVLDIYCSFCLQEKNT